MRSIFISFILCCWFSPAIALTPVPSNDTVFLEQMTWKEVKSAVEAGKKTVIIPTGGTEQNGPHMILGKHNYIVRKAAQMIAEDLGNALVAPVMAYVPEAPHMRYAGTISLRPETFAAVLEDTARSLKEHGFTLICFIGDSGDNQPVQKLVADKLNKEWEGSGVRVLHVSDYYSEKNGQDAWLLTQGYHDDEIKGHAALSDTSELYHVNPPGIRKDEMRDVAAEGSTGPSSRATQALGSKLLPMKAYAAAKQIRAESQQ